MAATVKIWVNNSPPQVDDADLNGFKEENNNLIVGSGQILDDSDNQQTHKAVAHYAAGGDFYTDSGAVNDYILSPGGSRVAPPGYFTGMRVRFVAGTPNSGASTVDVGGLGDKDIVQTRGTSVDVVAGQIADDMELEFDGTRFFIIVAGSNQLPDWTRAEPVGSVLNIPGTGDPAITPIADDAEDLGSFVAFVDSALEDLRVFGWDGKVYTAVGSVLNIPGLSTPAITTTRFDRIALVDGGNKDLQIFGWNGTIFSTVGAPKNLPGIGGGMGIATMRVGSSSDVDVVMIDQTSEDLQMFNFNGTTFTAIGTPLNLPGIGAANLTAMSNTLVAVASGISNMQMYFWNGSAFSPIGTGLGVGTGAIGLVGLNDTDIIVISSVTENLRVARFDGVSLNFVSNNLKVAGIGNVKLCTLGGTDISFIDSSVEDLRTFRVRFSLGRAPGLTII